MNIQRIKRKIDMFVKVANELESKPREQELVIKDIEKWCKKIGMNIPEINIARELKEKISEGPKLRTQERAASLKKNKKGIQRNTIDIQELLRLRNEGHSIQEIADLMEVPYYRIVNASNRYIEKRYVLREKYQKVK